MRSWRGTVVVLLVIAAPGCGGGSPSAQCSAMAGQSCSTSADCCSSFATLSCVDGTCQAPQQTPACGPTNCAGCCDVTGRCLTGITTGSCGTGGDACKICRLPGKCSGGMCVSTACSSAGASCATTANCCSPLVCGGGTCRSATACRSQGQACAVSSDCCGSLVCFSGQCAVAGMTWQIANQYGSNINLRFFDETMSLVWPDANDVYFITPGQTLDYPLACTPGDQVCYGADNDAQTVAWGVGIYDNMACPSCCASCDGQVHSIALTP